MGRRTSLLETHADDVRAGWDREYTRAIKTVAKKPVLLVGRLAIGVADELVGSGDTSTPSCLRAR